MEFSYRERFIGLPNPITGGLYAPLTLGYSKYIHTVDYKVFKKSREEKSETSLIKAKHKHDLLQAYGKGNIGKKLNVTSSLPLK